MKLLFVTGNQGKADRLSEYLGIEIDHRKIDVEEIQSSDIKEVAKDKALKAYEIVGQPVLVDDVSLEFDALGGLPGAFVRWFVEDAGLQAMCDMIRENRKAVGRCVMCYYDGKQVYYFEGKIEGSVSKNPRGDKGYGWDPIFIPSGYEQTRAELDDKDAKDIYLKIRKIDDLKKFLIKAGF